MKTLLKLAKAELMTKEGFEKGDFRIEFSSLWCRMEQKNTKIASSVFFSVSVYELEGQYASEPFMHHGFKMFDFGFVTPKGYKSSKPIPFEVVDEENITLIEVAKLKGFKAEYKINTFDPFYLENQAKSRNAAAWNFIAANYITDPYCTK